MIFFLLPPSVVLFCSFRFWPAFSSVNETEILHFEPFLICVDSSVDSDWCFFRSFEYLLFLFRMQGLLKTGYFLRFRFLGNPICEQVKFERVYKTEHTCL